MKERNSRMSGRSRAFMTGASGTNRRNTVILCLPGILIPGIWFSAADAAAIIATMDAFRAEAFCPEDTTCIQRKTVPACRNIGWLDYLLYAFFPAFP